MDFVTRYKENKPLPEVAYKTGSWHFYGMVPNIFIRKSMIARCLMPILVWFYDNWFFEWSTNTSYQRCGSQTTACHKKRNRLFVLSMFEAQNIKKSEIVFYSILFYLRLIHGNHFTHSTVTSFFLIKPEVDIFRVWFLIFSLESRWFRVVKCPYWLDFMIIDFSNRRLTRLISAVGAKP